MLAFIFVLGVMVLFHELGHYLAARYFGVTVESFAFGFGPRLFGFKSGDTDFKVCLLPLGGYVKFAGDTLGEPTGVPGELLSKPRWQRLIILAMGPIFNFILAIGLLTGLYMNKFERPEFIDLEPEVAYVQPGTAAAEAGIQPGDIVRSLDGHSTPTWQDLEMVTSLALDRTVPVEVDRNGRPMTFEVAVVSDEQRPGAGYTGWSEGYDVVLTEIASGAAAHAAGLEAGDQVRVINGEKIRSTTQVVDVIQASNGEPFQIEVERGDGAKHSYELAAERDEADGAWRIGVRLSPRYKMVQAQLGFTGALDKSIVENRRSAGMIFNVFGGLFAGNVSPRTIAGPIGIYEHSKQAADIGPTALIGLMALISMNLGIFNLLPIPIMDGGQIVMLLFESAMRRDVSLVVKERIVQVGFVFIVLLFAFVMYNDLLNSMSAG